MWCRGVSMARGRGPAAAVTLTPWRAHVAPRRWASSSSSSPTSSASSTASSGGSRSHFRAGVVNPAPYQVKPNFNVPLWQPPAWLMKYPAIRWLSNNLFALATYQLVLEVGFTIVFGSLLYAEKITAQGVRDWLERAHYPFVSWIDVDEGVYTDPVKVGPFSLSPQKMTALHTGHNIANGLLPVQVVLMLSTFAPVHHLYRTLRHLPPMTPAAAPASAATHTTAPSAAAAGVAPRRASYARASAKTAALTRPPF